jgi:hypothetical protein
VRLVGETTLYEGVVTAAHGSVVQVGETCAVALRGTNHPSYNCRIVVRCGRELLYGLADSGYNRCVVDESQAFVAAIDRHPTRADGDPRMRFDLGRGRVLLSDDNPDLRLEVALRRAGSSPETSTGRATDS